jgi:hypothetical protein
LKEDDVTGVDVIVAALAAGAGAGSSDVAKAAVTDAYSALRDALRRRLAGRPGATQSLETGALEPEEWRAALQTDLIDSGAAYDERIMAAAHAVLDLLTPSESPPGKYITHLGEARGVQIGDGNVQHNTFS